MGKEVLDTDSDLIMRDESVKSSVDIRRARRCCREDGTKGRPCLRLIEAFQSFSSSRMLRQMVPEG